MEKDIGKIPKNDQTDVVVRIDDFGGKIGLTIREFTTSERYTGFTKSGTRIPAEKIQEFKDIIAAINPDDFKAEAAEGQESLPEAPAEEKTSEEAPSEDY